MTRGQFEQAFDGLPKRRREVLELFLVGMDDEEIARTLQVKAVTVRSQLRNICDAFGLENEFPDDRTSRRGDLIDLFQQYKPELVKEEEKRSQFDPNFVGREEAIADLNALIENGAKCIQILSAGGQGKTTLAWKFLKTRFAEKDILYFPIGKETKDIASIESLVEERLRILGEEPGREFLVSLERLRERLTHQPMGVLIDNLEPALDESNQFVAQHRSYVELFKQVLLSPEVRSLTLITSRAPLQEGLAIQKYTLKPLSLEAWEQYFQHRKIVTDSTVLQEVCGTYNGNALAMEILCSAIRDEEDYENNLAAYWTDNKTEEGVYIEDSVLNLIREQFKNLERLKPNAYKLLCRMGCFRYQDVPTVPEEGLFCLLWDVDKSQHKRVVKVLKNRALVNVVDGEYRLHPVVRSEALARLRETEDWERVNQVAAEFWTKSVKTVQTIDDILKAFEAYLHYLNIHAFEEAGVVITFERSNEWSVEEPLGRSLYRIGQLKKAIVSISYILDKIQSYHCRASLYNILGDLYWLVGNLKKSIECHNDSEKISLQALNKERKDQIRKICSIKSPFEIFIPIATFNIGLCKIDMWEIEDSLILFEKCKYLLKEYSFSEEYRLRFEIDINFCLSFLNSCIGHKKIAIILSQAVIDKIDFINYDVWSRGYSFLFLALTYKNLGNLKQSKDLFFRAVDYAEKSEYIQVKAKALTGLAELYRIQSDFEKAINYHQESIRILSLIGAKCDLAEAYYQLALTYQAMNNPESQTHFNKALKLWTEIDAPKQCDRIRNSMNNPPN